MNLNLFFTYMLLFFFCQDARAYGWDTPEKVNHNWLTMIENVQSHIGSLNWGYRVQLRDKKVDYINAFAKFTDPHTIHVSNHGHPSQCHYASPSSGEAYRDRQLTTNFELWVEIFCVPTCFHVRIPKPCLSVSPEKRNNYGFVNISPTLVIDTLMKRSSRVLQHGNTKS